MFYLPTLLGIQVAQVVRQILRVPGGIRKDLIITLIITGGVRKDLISTLIITGDWPAMGLVVTRNYGEVPMGFFCRTKELSSLKYASERYLQRTRCLGPLCLESYNFKENNMLQYDVLYSRF